MRWGVASACAPWLCLEGWVVLGQVEIVGEVEGTGVGSPRHRGCAQMWSGRCAIPVSCSVCLENNSVTSSVSCSLPPSLHPSPRPFFSSFLSFLLALSRAGPVLSTRSTLVFGCPYECQEVDPDSFSHGFRHMGPLGCAHLKERKPGRTNSPWALKDILSWTLQYLPR